MLGVHVRMKMTRLRTAMGIVFAANQLCFPRVLSRFHHSVSVSALLLQFTKTVDNMMIRQSSS
jgi:hypothetical protein